MNNLTVPINATDRKRAMGLAKERMQTFNKARVRNQKIDRGRDSVQTHYIGLIGEITIEKIIGIPLTNHKAPHGDGGVYDFIIKDKTVQVKCTDYLSGHLIFPLKKGKMSFLAEYGILVIWDKKKEIATAVGQITRERFLAEHVIKEWGYGPTPAVPQHTLDHPWLLEKD